MEWNVDDKTRSAQDREMHQYLDSVLFYVYDNAFRFCTGTNAYFSLLLTYTGRKTYINVSSMKFFSAVHITVTDQKKRRTLCCNEIYRDTDVYFR